MNSRDLAIEVREVCVRLCNRHRASHIGGAFSVADILAVLYGDPILRFRNGEPKWQNRDRLFYSKGHACTSLYATLEAVGFSTGLIDNFTQNGSYWTSHVNHRVPGVELSTGSLGHALPVAAGTALAGKRLGNSWKVYCIVSDGELDEGSNWESILFAPHHNLGNLCLIVDSNKIQSFGSVEETLGLESLERKFEAFNWSVSRLDGHDHSALRQALVNFRDSDTTCPSVIIADTIKGKGVSFMENQLSWHYKSPNDHELELALKELKKV